MVRIDGVEPHSPAEKAGVQEGDLLKAINGHPVQDVLDYRFYITEPRVCLTLERRGRELELTLQKPRYDDPGLCFSTFLMDEKKTCRNGCVFCFIDQNPPGMRPGVYFKDDDTRLSFLQGNYVTLTNVSTPDLERICQMKLFPVNVSVHTTDPALRCRMLNNRFAGDIMEKLRFLAQHGATINAQLVLCRGWNDGDALERTLQDLKSLGEALQSVAVVPAGLTDHRRGLTPLQSFDAVSAGRVLDQVAAFGKACQSQLGTQLAFCSDEFYLTAGRPIPPGEYYEGYPQLDNGVGSLACWQEELEAALEELGPAWARAGGFTLFTGVAAYGAMKASVERIQEALGQKLSCQVIAAPNRFFGAGVTVAGLLTAGDILAAAQGVSLGDKVLLPARMLRQQGDLFLDDKTPAWLAGQLGRELIFVEDAAHLVQVLTQEKE